MKKEEYVLKTKAMIDKIYKELWTKFAEDVKALEVDQHDQWLIGARVINCMFHNFYFSSLTDAESIIEHVEEKKSEETQEGK